MWVLTIKTLRPAEALQLLYRSYCLQYHPKTKSPIQLKADSKVEVGVELCKNVDKNHLKIIDKTCILMLFVVNKRGSQNLVVD